MVDSLAKSLTDMKYSTACLHGDIDQNKRSSVMKEFRAGKIDFLIATDVAARGLDIDNLEAVINYDIPRFDQDYVHRIGRTGRAGKVGLALTLVVDKEVNHIERIARKNNMTIAPAKIPEREDLESNSMEAIKALIENSEVNRKDLDKYIAFVSQLEMYEYQDKEIAAIIVKTLIDQTATTFENVDFAPSKRSRSGSGRSGRDRPKNRKYGDRDRSSAKARGYKRGDRDKSSAKSSGHKRSDFKKSDSKYKSKSSSKRPPKVGKSRSFSRSR